MIDATHDPDLQSWVEPANQPDANFPIQSLPYGTFVRKGHEQTRLGIAIGDMLLDVAAASQITSMDFLMALPRPLRIDLRRRASGLLSKFASGADRFLLP